MQYRMSHILLLICLALAGFVSTYAQAGADNKGSILAKPGEDDKETAPKTFRESLEKMRIEKDKKDHDQMIERGSDLVKLTEELEKDVEANGRLSEKEKPKLSTVEKLAKKIRSELGGDDDKGDDDENPTASSIPLSPASAVKSLNISTQKLYEELKKTSRFTISAAAIQSSNSVLKITRFLRLSN